MKEEPPRPKSRTRSRSSWQRYLDSKPPVKGSRRRLKDKVEVWDGERWVPDHLPPHRK